MLFRSGDGAPHPVEEDEGAGDGAPHPVEQDEDAGNGLPSQEDQDEAQKQSILFPDPERINLFIEMYTPSDRTPDVSYSHLSFFAFAI